jgi:hypothetical protein
LYGFYIRLITERNGDEKVGYIIRSAGHDSLRSCGFNHARLVKLAGYYDWTGVLVPTNSSWIVRLYESTDASINFSNLLPTGDDTYTGNQFTFASSGLTDGFSKKTISFPSNISSSDKIYSVIFNSTDSLTATRWAVIDGALATVSFSPSTFNYNPGGVAAGDWQAVPEPATALLFGIGSFGAWLIRRNKKLKAQEDIND